MTKVVGVRFSDTGKTYYFDPKGLDIKNGDEIIVETCLLYTSPSPRDTR